jgi:hypothetical protein
MLPLRPVLLATLLLTGCPRGARPDDALEPNDDPARATPLALDTAVEARANQGNPDVFSVEAPAGRTLIFLAESRGLEVCPAFTVNGPGGEALFEDVHANCNRTAEEPRKAPGVEFHTRFGAGTSAEAYELRIPTAQPGRYLLTILEQGRADNLAPFSWDYRLTARVE